MSEITSNETSENTESQERHKASSNTAHLRHHVHFSLELHGAGEDTQHNFDDALKKVLDLLSENMSSEHVALLPPYSSPEVAFSRLFSTDSVEGIRAYMRTIDALGGLTSSILPTTSLSPLSKGIIPSITTPVLVVDQSIADSQTLDEDILLEALNVEASKAVKRLGRIHADLQGINNELRAARGVRD